MLTDLRLAWRRLARAPGFTVIATATIAFAIGANTAILSVADAVLFRPLGYSDEDRLRIVQMRDPATDERYTLVPPEYLNAIEESLDGIGEVGYLETGTLIATGPQGAAEVRTASVSAGYFGILGVVPFRGRLFDDGDVAGDGRTALLSHAAWLDRFGGAEEVVGQPVTLGSATWDIVGVLPPDFRFPTRRAGAPSLVTVLPPRPADEGAFDPVLRLDPGMTGERAQAALDAITAGITSADRFAEGTVPVFEEVRDVLYDTGRPIMVFLLAAAVLVLLIACANLANLFLAASRRRERETGIAGAIGATRLRLIRPVVLESSLIALIGAGLAVLVASLAFDLLLRLVPRAAYGAAAVGVDARVGMFALGMGIVAGLLTSVVPAWRTARLDPYAVVTGVSGTGRRRRLTFGRPMVAVQVALAVVVVFGAAIAARAFVALLRVPLGVTTGNVAVILVGAPGEGGFERQTFYERAVALLDDHPEIVSAGATGSLPVVDGVPWSAARRVGDDSDVASVVHVLPGYFETVGIRLVAGRLLDADDLGGGGANAVVSETAARALFPDRSPLGSSFVDTQGQSFTVVGVVSDVRMRPDRQPPPPAYALPGADTRRMTIVARTGTTGAGLLAALRRDVMRMAPGAIVEAAWWADEIAALTPYRNPRFQTTVLGTFALLALAVTALGIFGVIAFTMALRRREMGIRLALGIAPAGLVRLMMRYALAPVAVGIAAGLVATRALARLAEAQLFQVETSDPLTLGATVLTVLVAASAAAWLPARRATKLDPVRTLKTH